MKIMKSVCPLPLTIHTKGDTMETNTWKDAHILDQLYLNEDYEHKISKYESKIFATGGERACLNSHDADLLQHVQYKT
jgi:hypothetical protein